MKKKICVTILIAKKEEKSMGTWNRIKDYLSTAFEVMNSSSSNILSLQVELEGRGSKGILIRKCWDTDSDDICVEFSSRINDANKYNIYELLCAASKYNSGGLIVVNNEFVIYRNTAIFTSDLTDFESCCDFYVREIATIAFDLWQMISD